MLLVLWVIRLLNGADITPGGQGVGFDCVIEFCFFFFFFLPSPTSSSSSFLGSWEEDFSVAAGRSGQGACLWFRLDHKVFPLTGHHGDPFKKMCVSAECVCLCGMWICGSVCVCVCVCLWVHAFSCVCAPVSLGALLCCHLQPDKPKDLSPSELPLSGG